MKLKIPYRNESERYQVFYEKTTDDGIGIVNNILEYYDGLKNFGFVQIDMLDITYNQYTYFDEDEMLLTLSTVKLLLLTLGFERIKPTSCLLLNFLRWRMYSLRIYPSARGNTVYPNNNKRQTSYSYSIDFDVSRRE